MSRLILAELRRNALLWIGLFATVVVVAVVLSIGAGLYATGIRVGGARGGDLMSAVIAILLFTIITGIIVIASAAMLTVSLQRKRIALLRLAGTTPGQIRWSVVGQIAVVAAVAAVLALVVASPFLQPTLEFYNAGRTDGGLPGVTAFFDVTTAIAAVLGVTVLTVLGSLPALRRAGTVPAIEALRQTDTTPPTHSVWKRLGVVRLLLLAASLTTLAGLLSTMATSLPPFNLDSIFYLGPCFAVLSVATAPLVYPWVLGVWTRIVPTGASGAWFLARSNAQHHLAVNLSTISPIVTASVLIGGLFTSSELIENVLIGNDPTPAETGGTDWTSLTLIIGPPIIIAAVGATMTIVMSNRDRGRDLSLLAVTGATHGSLVAVVAFEAIIYSVTALIVSVGTVALQGVLSTFALNVSSPGTDVAVSALSPVLICALGFVLIMAATVVPSLVTLRRPAVRVLAAD